MTRAEAYELVDALEQSRSSGLTDSEIDAIDARILRALDALGSSSCR
jgi:hypothetical protein